VAPDGTIAAAEFILRRPSEALHPALAAFRLHYGRPERARDLQPVAGMTISLTGLLLLLVIAGVCGAVGRAIGGGTRGGVLVSIAVGFIGALFGTLIAQSMRLPEPLVVSVDRHPFPILWSIIGAALFVALVHLISGSSRRPYFRSR
jgi:uncharacterized membrane protein YeaQ/YmgE (transglycosylase-associated protein family)